MQNLSPILMQRKSIQKLSEDEIQRIASFLSPKDTVSLSNTSHFFSETTQENPVWEDKLTPEARRRIVAQDSQSALKLFRGADENRPREYRSMAYFIQSDEKTKHMSPLIIKLIKDEASSHGTDFKPRLRKWCSYCKLADISEYKIIEGYIIQGKLSIESALSMRGDETDNVCLPFVKKYIDSGKLTPQEGKKDTLAMILRCLEIQKLLDDGLLSWDQLKEHYSSIYFWIDNPWIIKAIQKGKITSTEVLSFGGCSFYDLEKKLKKEKRCVIS